MMAAGERDGGMAPGYKWYALGLLFLVNVFHVIDRQVFSILQDSIKAELHLSDTVLGLLGGFAFALFYATLGIPIARLADRRNRVKIVAICLFIWSGMTALCGMAVGAVTLALARVGVGVGEAGCSPATQSLLSDYFPPERRATAFGILTAGTSVGLALGFFLGGTLDHVLGWRGTLILLWLPGMLLSFVVFFALREPPRGAWDAMRAGPKEAPPLVDVFRLLWRIPTFRFVLVAYALHYFAVQGAGPWKASFFRRSFPQVDTGTLGLWLGVAAALGVLGVLGGGWAADRLARRDKRWLTWLPVLTMLAGIPFFVAMLFVQDWRWAVAFYTLDVGLNVAFTGPTLALMQQLVPARMRAVAASIVLLIISLLGMGLGPLVVGGLSDLLSARLGAESLRYALLVAVAVNLGAIAAYLRASRTVRADIANPVAG